MDKPKQFDIFVIGGGINGTAIAADAAGRGLKVGLCEAHDLGQATYSPCGMTFHGGIRHLERFKFHTLHKTLKEINILLNRAPHLIHAIPFIIPCNKQSRPRWVLQSGLALYDMLGNKHLRPYIAHCDMPKDPLTCLNPHTGNWLVYPECGIDDSRLVISNALSAADNSATILPRTRCKSAESINGLWHLTLEDVITAEHQKVLATTIANATGAQVEKTISETLHSNTRCHTEFLKHNYIVVRKFYLGKVGYKLQQNKRQVMTISPLCNDYCLIGPLVESHDGSDAEASISTEEIQRLLNIVNALLETPLTQEDIVTSYANIRAIYRDPASPSGTSQDCVLDFSCSNGNNPIVSIIGGSLLTHRVLAEQAIELLSPYLPHLKKPWTAESVLPGGQLFEGNDQSKYISRAPTAGNAIESLVNRLTENYQQLPSELLERLARCYGSRSFDLLGDKQKIEDLGQHFGHQLYETECAFLVTYEWAGSADDIIWRRSKVGLQFDDSQTKALTNWFVRTYQYNPAVKTLSA